MKTLLVLAGWLLIPVLGVQICPFSSNSTCQWCLTGYYLNPADSSCQPCSSLTGCTVCSNSTNCSSCQTNYTLLSGACVYCPSSNYFQATTFNSCQPCLSNCLSCSEATNCLVCASGYYLVKAATAGADSCNLIAAWPGVAAAAVSDVKEYLLTLMPRMRAPIYSPEDVMSVCQSNGYTCLCVNLSTTSRCTDFDQTAVTTVFTGIGVKALTLANYQAYALAVEAGIANTTYTKSILDILLTVKDSTDILIDKFGINRMNLIFETIAKLYYDNTNIVYLQSTVLPAITNFIYAKLFTDATSKSSVILQGNGYIYRLSSFISSSTPNTNYSSLHLQYTSNVSGYSSQLLLFNRSLKAQPFSGSLLTTSSLSPSDPAPTVEYSIPRLSSLQSLTGIFNLMTVNGITNQTLLSSISSSNSVFTFTVSSSNTTYSIASTNSSEVFQAYDIFRIENLFFQNSFFYVLFFLLLYIVFFPLCLLVDFVDYKKTGRHKRVVVREDGTAEDIKADPREGTDESAGEAKSVTDPSDEGTEIVVPVSYKQFHPVYNIASTQHRPSRLHKLSLYLLNMQHSLTFLIVLYNAAPTPRTPMFAILLAIPAYILNILAGYLFGFVKNKLPNNWKFLINVVPPGYWVLWVFLMKSWDDVNSPQYQGYLILFVIILWFLDQVFDLLQMLMMYFVLKEDNTVRPCISKVLSVRGYFEYEKYQ